MAVRASTGQRGAPAKNTRESMSPNKKKPSMKKMDPKKKKEQQEKAERLLKVFAVRKMQRLFRVQKIRAAVRAVHQLEDFALEGVPTPGLEAYEFLFEGPNPEETGGEKGLEMAMRLYGSDEQPSTADSAEKKPPSDEGSVLSKSMSKARISEAGSVSGSRPSSSGTYSQRSQLQEEALPRLTEELLIFRLEEFGVVNPVHVAHLIFWILECDGELSPDDLEVIHRHHRIRRRNLVSRVNLRLILVQHGKADWLGAADREDAAQPLLPEGWAQVTRAGWSLRALGRSWLPGLVLRASPHCCAETAERLRLIADDGGGTPAVTAESNLQRTCTPSSHRSSNFGNRRGSSSPASRRRSSAMRRRSRMEQHDQMESEDCSFPVDQICDALNFPRPSRELKLGCPAIYDIGVEIGRILRSSERPLLHPSDQPDEPTPILLVAGPSVLELLLACLTGARPREECLTARLTGGDAVLLTSPFMCQLAGEGLQESWRLNSQLWAEALRRGDWQVNYHLRGDGRGLREEDGGWPPPPSPLFKGKPDAKWTDEKLTSTWIKYTGAPLILGDLDYKLLRQRAGLEHTPLQDHVQKALKGLTRRMPDTPPKEEEEEKAEEEQGKQQQRGQPRQQQREEQGAFPSRRFGLFAGNALNKGFSGLPGKSAS